MHTDEAVNGYITGQLLAGDSFQYDPQDRHGPTLYLATVPVVRAFGEKSLTQLNERTVRLVPVIFSVLVILLLAAAASQIGFVSCVVAALLFAVAPLPVYYSRYFIHEMLFVAGTLGFALSGWRTLERKSIRAAIAAGACAAWMLACKETALLHFAAFAVPLIWWIWIRRTDLTRRSSRWNALWKPALITAATFLVVTFVFYTWGGKNWSGPIDLIRSIPRFAQRAGGEGHEKSVAYYWSLLIGNGHGMLIIGLALLAFVVSMRSIARQLFSEPAITELNRKLPLQLWSLYSVAILVIYCVIPYKNPWLALNFWFALAILAGTGFQLLWLRFPKMLWRCCLAAILGIGIWRAGVETQKWVFARPADDRNPYAYAHTVDDVISLPEKIQKLAGANANPFVAVVAEDPWPLPWYLRKFQKVGFYQPSQFPTDADFYITSLEAAAQMETHLESWRPDFVGIRPEVLMLLWKRSQ